ncbi:MAG: putative DNA-binding domain-containing protein [Hyphomicrobiales bacterium]|nr:putative DNA-binding domain-containing protein [Hyphomicrobiales bacterium]
MSFETTVRAFAAALDDPSAATPAMTRGRMGAPDARRFAVYRNNVAVGLIGALEARYPVSRRIAGEDLFRAMARAFVRAYRPRSPVMIAYGGEFPEFVAEYLAGGPGREDAREWDRHREEQSDAAIQEPSAALRSPGLLRHSPSGRTGVFRRPSARNDDGGSTHLVSCLVDVARLENAWVEAYHAEDARVAAVVDLAVLNPDALPGARIVFHPAARLLRFITPAASVWASAQDSDHRVTLTEGAGEDALITRPDCDVRVRVLPTLAHDFALQLREGATLIEAAAAMNDSAFDFGAHLVGLVESGAVASIIPGVTP